MDTYNNRPMSYESSKILLQYLEANTRFQLSNRIPSIRKMEKLVPMKLHTLKFSLFEFMINDTRYKLGTCRDYPTGVEVLYGHQNDNLKGGVQWDLDQYGFRNFSDGDVVTPGDLVIKDPFLAEPNPPDYEFLESTLRVFKWVSAKRSGQEMDPLDEHIQEGFLVYQNPEITNEFLQKTISELEATLAPFRCRRERTQRPFTTSIQLTVVSPGGEFQIWRKPTVHPVQNTIFKLYEAQKQLADRLFGNRADNVCVKNFEITSDHLHPLMIVRLPPSFQIKIESLTIRENAPTICNAIQDLVHESSYPLRKVEYKGRNRLTVHPTIAGARELHFVFYVFAGIQELLLFRNHNISITSTWETILSL
ncbi:hypothetical protein CAEBREN_18787 [Caenorhabditis brenneri]|uniref:Uncharacterized protein n=1 Tax=Caenorhabditis brenneri TaxID=135651 RepID=G0MMG4_CAEBE|nr:hypothetical protein CAEBREN_18787 [Caenorhabditis brenneri]